VQLTGEQQEDPQLAQFNVLPHRSGILIDPISDLPLIGRFQCRRLGTIGVAGSEGTGALILVIGGRSKIGAALIDGLLERDQRVRLLVRPGEHAAGPAAVEVVTGDLADEGSLVTAMEGSGPASGQNRSLSCRLHWRSKRAVGGMRARRLRGCKRTFRWCMTVLSHCDHMDLYRYGCSAGFRRACIAR
jgi:NAD(P)H-binding